MTNVKPSNDNNAIKVIAFVLEFQQEIDESTVDKLRVFYQNNAEIKKDLPREQLLHTMMIQMEGQQQVSNKQVVGGVAFDSLLANGSQEWSLSVRGNVVVVTCGRYTRWDQVWNQAKSYFSAVLPLLSDKTFKFITLEYVDEFFISNHNSEWKKELFNLESKYLPSNIHDLDGFWHSHHGFHLHEVQPVEQRVLNNIDIDYISDPGGHKLLIRTQHKSELLEAINYSENFMDETVDKIMNNNHTFNKELMVNLLSTEIQSKIKLETSS